MANKNYKKYLTLGVLLVAIVALVFASGCMETEDESNDTIVNPETVDVNVQYFAFEPAELIINAGDTVTWTNNEPSKVSHHVMSGVVGADDSGELFDSGEFGFEESFSYTFNDAGEYKYHDYIHTGMKGTIIVE